MGVEATTVSKTSRRVRVFVELGFRLLKDGGVNLELSRSLLLSLITWLKCCCTWLAFLYLMDVRFQANRSPREWEHT